MIAITVDDERPMLNILSAAVSASPDIGQVVPFMTCSDALQWVSSNSADIAFLDIHMRGMGGLALAEKIKEYLPDCKIVFCTGYEQYALEAIQLRCSGYLMKPITEAAVQREIDHIKTQRPEEKLLAVKCFGLFEVFGSGKMLNFKRSKSKEVLAVLVDRNGAGMTGKQICAIIWPEQTDDAKNMDYLRHLFADLKSSLEAAGAGSVLCQDGYSYRIDPKLIQCDYHNYLKTGKPEFFGEYMTQYSWAETTCAMLERRN